MSNLAATIQSAVAPPAASSPAPTPAAPTPPAVAAAAPSVDLDAIRTEAATAERARITSIDVLAVAGCETLIADAKAKGWTPGETAIAVVAKIKADGMLDAVAAMQTAAATVPPLAASPSQDGNHTEVTTPEGPEKWAKDWHASVKLQEDFPTVESYVAVKKREKPAA